MQVTNLKEAVERAKNIGRAWIGQVGGVQTKAFPDGKVYQYDNRGRWAERK